MLRDGRGYGRRSQVVKPTGPWSDQVRCTTVPPRCSGVIMLVRHGHVVAEGWWRPFSADRPHLLYSLSKSFTSTAAAFAAAEGLVDLDDTVVSHFPEFEADITDPGSRSMRIRHIAAEHPEQECRS